MKNAMLGCLLAFGLASGGMAQETDYESAAPIVPAVSGEQMALPTVNADTPDTEQWNRVIGQVWVRNVSKPSLYRVAPKNGRGNGRSVIVVPGGGYVFVSIESEGFWVAERLAARGYTAFVLKYRTRATPEKPADFARELFEEWEGGSDQEDGGQEDYSFPPAVEDLAAAITMVRAEADTLGLDRDKIGVVGFSAGAISAIDLMEDFDEAAQIDNVGLIYPAVQGRLEVDRRPDLFMAIATDDFLYHRGMLDVVGDWTDAGSSVEFHLYSGGAHGFGMRPQGTTSDLWIDQYLAWLDLR